MPVEGNRRNKGDQRDDWGGGADKEAIRMVDLGEGGMGLSLERETEVPCGDSS